MKKLLFTIVAFFFFASLSAQISGYMGNRFSFIYNGGVSFPHITGVGGKIQALPTFNSGFNFEYIYSNNAAVGFRYKLGYSAGKNPTSSGSGSVEIDHTELANFEEKYKFYSHSYGAYVKFYRRNSLAPIGLYTLLGINFQQLILKDMVRPNYVDQSIITKQNYVHYDVAFNFGLGRNWIIGDRLLIGIQGEIGYPFASVMVAAGLGSYESGSNSSFNGYKTSAILSKFNLTSEVLRLSLNIGFLAF